MNCVYTTNGELSEYINYITEIECTGYTKKDSSIHNNYKKYNKLMNRII